METKAKTPEIRNMRVRSGAARTGALRACNLAILLAIGLSVLPLLGDNGTNSPPASRPELDYLKAVNQAGPPQDPQLLFLLMGQYSNANRQAEGVEFFSARFTEFGPRLNDVQKALYLSAIGL